LTATDIDGVIRELDAVIVNASEMRDPVAYFAALYRQVTLAVKTRMKERFFADNARIDQLVTRFANRYLEALAIFRDGNKPTRSWCVAFSATRVKDITILQHLLLGINAHINLDLGICLAEVYPGGALAAARGDFERVHTILSTLMDEVEGVVERFSPLLGILDKLGGPVDEALVNFSIGAARDDAWQHAQLLAAQNATDRLATIDLMDTKAAFLARLVAEPGRILAKAMELIHMRESNDVPAVTAALNAIVAPP
jgi:hypothetical protein